jgi:putative aldouronate transport system permease protein
MAAAKSIKPSIKLKKRKNGTFDIRGREWGFDSLVYGILLIWTLIILIPFIYVLFSSFATKTEILTRGFFIIPRVWTLDAYKYLMLNDDYTGSFKNAVHITVVGTFLSITTTSLMAYGLSKSWLRGRKILNFMVFFTMLFGGGMIPTYLVIKEIGLLDSYWALWLHGMIGPFNLIIMRSFFQRIPPELQESARMDGCGEFRMFWKLIVPLSMPVIATFTLFYGVGNWNTYFEAILYINDTSRWPLQPFLRQMLVVDDSGMDQAEGIYEYSPAVKMAAVLVSAIPVLAVYPFLQKYFNKGVLLGSVKG